MKKFKNHQRPCRKYRFNIVGHKKNLKNITWSISVPGFPSSPVARDFRYSCRSINFTGFKVNVPKNSLFTNNLTS